MLMKREEEKHYEKDGQVVIFRRTGAQDNTPYYYVRIKRPDNGKWKRYSTGTTDLDKAREIALDRYKEVHFLHERNMPIASKSFADVATLVLKHWGETGNIGQKNDYTHCLLKLRDGVAKKGEEPKGGLGRTFITNVTTEDLNIFLAALTDRLGRTPNRSTLNNYNAALSHVCQYAIERGWISDGTRLKIKCKAEATKQRPYFSGAEFKKLINFLSDWRLQPTRKKISAEIREFLYHYVLFLSATGIRPGTEARFLKWNQISRIEKQVKVKDSRNPQKIKSQKRSFLKIKIGKGKTGGRELIATPALEEALTGHRASFEHLKALPLDQIFTRDEYVWRLPNGSIPKDIHGAFKRALVECGLLKDTDGKTRSLYSVRHYYATAQITRKMNQLELARSMGTSVAMLEKHYYHAVVLANAEHTAGLDVWSDDYEYDDEPFDEDGKLKEGWEEAESNKEDAI